MLKSALNLLLNFHQSLTVFRIPICTETDHCIFKEKISTQKSYQDCSISLVRTFFIITVFGIELSPQNTFSSRILIADRSTR